MVHEHKACMLQAVEEARSVVCTKKINGEAAHLGACTIRGEVFLCAGSKNVHMLFRNKSITDNINRFTPVVVSIFRFVVLRLYQSQFTNTSD